jgi:hypothetical protein
MGCPEDDPGEINEVSQLERSESQRKKNIGKPDEGEPHVRFDEGELERVRRPSRIA